MEEHYRVGRSLAETLAMLRNERAERRALRKANRVARQLWLSELSWGDNDKWTWRTV